MRTSSLVYFHIVDHGPLPRAPPPPPPSSTFARMASTAAGIFSPVIRTSFLLYPLRG